ncbi:AmiS/UreI family transporter [Arthrobacter sp. ISL-72]|uniref:AmiS/UreI family transporter n=1 Tax=Arthrobacter sp. ISL-72 TaxID=2819114 RepID=UPI001BEA6600|nr:AmiS/UreI family transporter [Arthrobacter sp. ISL-72]MBT2596880.1 AmiS/UreI transporter [Arthrobacter sp. ISL-72]
MAYVCLLLSGAALLLNGLAALDLLPRRDAAIFSLVIGSAQLVLGVTYLAVTYPAVTDPAVTDPDVSAGGGSQLLLGASGMFLFGLTYVYVGLDFLLGMGSRGLGWFCGMVGLCGILLAAAWSGEDPLLAVLWLCWTYLWLLFFLQLALGFERLAPLIGWSLVLTSQASATVPAFLGISGQWPAGSEAAAAAAVAGAGLAALLLLAGGLAWRGRRSGTEAAVVERPLSGVLRR